MGSESINSRAWPSVAMARQSLSVIGVASLRDQGMRYGVRVASRASIQIATAQTATTMATVKITIAASTGASKSTLPSGVDRNS
jgi:hypothetical protein